MIDRDTLNWVFRLTITGTVFIALFSIFDSTPFVVRALGNLSILGALLFLIDVEGGNRFKCFYWSVLAIWIAVLFHSGLAFILKGEEVLEVFQTVTMLIYAMVLISIPLFTHTMRKLSEVAGLTELERKWRNLTRLSATYYIIPLIGFSVAFVGRAMGEEVQLYYGVDETSNLPIDFVKYGVRLLFFLPPVLVILGMQKTRDIMQSTLRPSQVPENETTP